MAYLRRSGDASHYYSLHSCSAKRGRSATKAVVVGAASSLHTPAAVSTQARRVFVACLKRSGDASHYYSYLSCSAKRGRFALLCLPCVLHHVFQCIPVGRQAMGIVSNILQTTFELIAISHQMVEALMLPHYPSPAKKSIDGMRRSTLPRTDNALHHIPVCRSHQDMHMIGHDDKGIYLVFYAVGMHHDVCKDISDTLVFEYACSIAGIYPSIYDSTEAIVIVLLYGGIPWFGMCIQPLFTLQPIFLQLGLRKRVGKTESDKLHTIVLIPMRDSCSRNMDVFSSVDELQRIVSHITYFCFVLFIIGVAEAGSTQAGQRCLSPT